MGKSDYILKAEQMVRIAEKEDNLRDLFAAIGNGEEIHLLNSALDSLLCELEGARKGDIISTAKEWDAYVEKLRFWVNKYFKPKKGVDDMARAMNEPNKPGYLFCNND